LRRIATASNRSLVATRATHLRHMRRRAVIGTIQTPIIALGAAAALRRINAASE
jgi:hypothetical protein